MEEWLDPNEKMQSYLLKDETSDIKNCGFVNFQEKTMNGKQVVYIAQMGVSSPGEGLGRRLMECVLNHYPVGTEFYILTRVFNTHAINLYEKRFKFESLEKSEIKALGYNDERYCGFKHTTTTQELAEIASKQVKLELSDSSLEIKKRKLTQRSG